MAFRPLSDDYIQELGEGIYGRQQAAIPQSDVPENQLTAPTTDLGLTTGIKRNFGSALASLVESLRYSNKSGNMSYEEFDKKLSTPNPDAPIGSAIQGAINDMQMGLIGYGKELERKNTVKTDYENHPLASAGYEAAGAIQSIPLMVAGLLAMRGGGGQLGTLARQTVYQAANRIGAPSWTPKVAELVGRTAPLVRNEMLPVIQEADMEAKQSYDDVYKQTNGNHEIAQKAYEYTLYQNINTLMVSETLQNAAALGVLGKMGKAGGRMATAKGLGKELLVGPGSQGIEEMQQTAITQRATGKNTDASLLNPDQEMLEAGRAGILGALPFFGAGKVLTKMAGGEETVAPTTETSAIPTVTPNPVVTPAATSTEGSINVNKIGHAKLNELITKLENDDAFKTGRPDELAKITSLTGMKGSDGLAAKREFLTNNMDYLTGKPVEATATTITPPAQIAQMKFSDVIKGITLQANEDGTNTVTLPDGGKITTSADQTVEDAVGVYHRLKINEAAQAGQPFSTDAKKYEISIPKGYGRSKNGLYTPRPKKATVGETSTPTVTPTSAPVTPVTTGDKSPQVKAAVEKIQGKGQQLTIRRVANIAKVDEPTAQATLEKLGIPFVGKKAEGAAPVKPVAPAPVKPAGEVKPQGMKTEQLISGLTPDNATKFQAGQDLDLSDPMAAELKRRNDKRVAEGKKPITAVKPEKKVPEKKTPVVKAPVTPVVGEVKPQVMSNEELVNRMTDKNQQNFSEGYDLDRSDPYAAEMYRRNSKRMDAGKPLYTIETYNKKSKKSTPKAKPSPVLVDGFLPKEVYKKIGEAFDTKFTEDGRPIWQGKTLLYVSKVIEEITSNLAHGSSIKDVLSHSRPTKMDSTDMKTRAKVVDILSEHFAKEIGESKPETYTTKTSMDGNTLEVHNSKGEVVHTVSFKEDRTLDMDKRTGERNEAIDKAVENFHLKKHVSSATVQNIDEVIEYKHERDEKGPYVVAVTKDGRQVAYSRIDEKGQLVGKKFLIDKTDPTLIKFKGSEWRAAIFDGMRKSLSKGSSTKVTHNVEGDIIRIYDETGNTVIATSPINGNTNDITFSPGVESKAVKSAIRKEVYAVQQKAKHTKMSDEKKAAEEKKKATKQEETKTSKLVKELSRAISAKMANIDDALNSLKSKIAPINKDGTVWKGYHGNRTVEAYAKQAIDEAERLIKAFNGGVTKYGGESVEKVKGQIDKLADKVRELQKAVGEKPVEKKGPKPDVKSETPTKPKITNIPNTVKKKAKAAKDVKWRDIFNLDSDANVKNVKAKGTGETLQVRKVDHNGQTYYVRDSVKEDAYVLYDSNFKPIGKFKYGKDVKTTKAAQEKILEIINQDDADVAQSRSLLERLKEVKQGVDADVIDAKANILTNDQLNDGQKLIRSFAEHLGIKVEFYNSKGDGKTLLSGFRERGSNTLWVNIASPIHERWIVGHEFTHWLRAFHSNIYNDLLKAIKISDVQMFKKMKELEERGYPNITDKLVREELLADIIANNFPNQKFWEQLEKKDKPLFERIVRRIADFFNKMFRNIVLGKELANALEKDTFVDTVQTEEQLAIIGKLLPDVIRDLVYTNMLHRQFYGIGEVAATLTDAQQDAERYIDGVPMSKAEVQKLADVIDENKDHSIDSINYSLNWVEKHMPLVSGITKVGKPIKGVYVKIRGNEKDLGAFADLFQSPRYVAQKFKDFAPIQKLAHVAQKTQDRLRSRFMDRLDEIYKAVGEEGTKKFYELRILADAMGREFSQVYRDTSGKSYVVGWNDSVSHYDSKAEAKKENPKATIIKRGDNLFTAIEWIGDKNIFANGKEADQFAEKQAAETMKSFGATDGIVKAYNMTRALYDKAHKITNIVRKTTGQDFVGYRTGYLPHMFENWMIAQKNADGKYITIASKATLREAIKAGNELKGQFGGDIFIFPKRTKFKEERMQQAFMGDNLSIADEQMFTDAVGVRLAEAQTLLGKIEGMDKGYAQHRLFGHQYERKGVEGWVKDLKRVDYRYMNAAARFMALEPFKKKATQYYAAKYGDIRLKPPSSLARYMKGYIESVNGNPTRMEEYINGWLDNNPWMSKYLGHYLGDRSALQLANNIAYATTIAKLGVFNFSSAILQVSQLINTFAVVGPKHTTRAIFKAMKLSPKDESILRSTGVAYDIGLDQPTGYTRIFRNKSLPEVLKAMGGREGLRAIADLSLFAFKSMDSYTRKVSTLAAYYDALERGIKGKDGKRTKATEKQAIEYAEDVNHRVNFDYSVADAPGIFRYLGPLATVFLQFKKYSVKELELFASLCDKQHIPELTRFMGGMFIMAGMMGVPAWDTLRGLLKFFSADFEKDIELEVKQQLMTMFKDSPWIAKWMMYGVFSPTIGLDISKRVGMGDFVPNEFSDLFGPAVSTVWNVYKHSINSLGSGGAGVDVLKSIAPILGNIAQAGTPWNPGESRNPITHKVNYRYTPADVIKKWAGFSPDAESLERDIAAIEKYGEDQHRKAIERAKKAYRITPSSENYDKLLEMGVSGKSIYQDTQKTEMTRRERTIQSIPKKRRPQYEDLDEFE